MADEKLPRDNVDEKEQIDNLIKSALDNEEIPTIYFNGFVTSVGMGDVMVVLNQTNKPVAILNMSYTLAKTLAEKLGRGIAGLEQKSGNTIMTTDDIKQMYLGDNDEAE